MGRELAGATFRLAASAGLRGAATASGPASLGVALAAGLALDAAVRRAWDWYADPCDQLVHAVRARLNTPRSKVLVGTPEGPGLKQQLAARTWARLSALRAAVLGTIDARAEREWSDR